MSGKSGPQRLNPGAIQRHNAYRNKYHAEPAEMSAVTQSDIQFVDLGLQDAVKLKRGGISVKEKAMQEKIAAAAAEIKRSKLPDHILTGIKVLAVIANIVSCFSSHVVAVLTGSLRCWSFSALLMRSLLLTSTSLL